MKKSYFVLIFAATALLIILFLWGLVDVLLAQETAPAEQGVYQYVLRGVEGDYEAAIGALEDGINGSDFHLLGKLPAAAPGDCIYRATVFLLYDSVYAAQMLPINRNTAPFGLLNRINIFQDEEGTHVSILNPLNVNRTVLMEDEKYNQLALQQRQKLRQLVGSALKGTPSDHFYGQMRKKGYIGRTMGVMAGGPFEGKVENVVELPGADFTDVMEKVKAAMSVPGEKWGLKLVFSLELPGEKIAVLGTTSPGMEAKSFDIVKAGSDKSRKDFACPGIAYAAAYPIEVVVRKKDDLVLVQLVNVMYRMKMFFEDAGKWAFMKNMGMPGSLQDEISNQIKSAFEK